MDYRERIDNNETQVSLWLPSELWRRVKAQASLTGLTVAAWTERSLRSSLEKQETAVANGVDIAAAVRGSGGRRKGRSRLKGRPLDENGTIVLTVERTTDPLHGLQEAIGTSEDFPMTTRPDYLGISRETSPTKDSSDWWAMPCQRKGCGKTRRSHQGKDGIMGRLFACSGFQETI